MSEHSHCGGSDPPAALSPGQSIGRNRPIERRRQTGPSRHVPVPRQAPVRARPISGKPTVQRSQADPDWMAGMIGVWL